MKKRTRLLALSAMFPAILFSCKKNNNSSTTQQVGPYTSMENVFAMEALQPLTVTVNATRDTSFYGNSGTRYIFYGNSFMTTAGAIVTGTIQLQVCEYLKKGDMIFSKMLPMSNGEPLISGGEINVSATQSGQALFLASGYYFEANVPQPGTPLTSMQFFSGQTATLDTTLLKTNWIQPVQDSGGASGGGFAQVVVGIGDTLDIISDSLRECNADQFMTSPDYQNFTVTTSISGTTLPSPNASALNILSSAPTVVYGYTLYDTYKGVWPLGKVGSYSNGIFTEEHVPNIPVHFVIFTIINGNFYGGILGSVTPATGSNYTVNLTEVNPDSFRAQVNGL